MATGPCPNCGGQSPLTPANPWRPFCCERCKLIDLGQWLQEAYSIPGEPVADDHPSQDQ